jgi:predicted nuclease of predicted toxin-antitoxin system
MAWKTIRFTKQQAAEVDAELGKRCRFLVDESLGSLASEVLNDLGWKTVFAGDAGLMGRSDEEVLAYAFRHDFVLLTHDHDFLDDRRFPEHRNPGVVVLPGASGSDLPLQRALGRLLANLAPYRPLLRGAKVRIAPNGSMTVRRRNKATGRTATRRFRVDKKGAYEWK